MASNLESVNIHILESKLLDEIELWDREGKEGEKTLCYIAGVHDMANAVIKAILELGGK